MWCAPSSVPYKVTYRHPRLGCFGCRATHGIGSALVRGFLSALPVVSTTTYPPPVRRPGISSRPRSDWFPPR
eukprot:8332-Prorocentrum_minimum.AAC.1